MADNGVLAFLVALHESAAGTRFPDAGGITVTAQEDPTSVEDRLRAIQSIIDAALSRLDDHDLLAKLLDRTRDALQADTAAVLLLDSPSGQLIATATAGLEEEVRQGVRIPRRPSGRLRPGPIASRWRRCNGPRRYRLADDPVDSRSVARRHSTFVRMPDTRHMRP